MESNYASFQDLESIIMIINNEFLITVRVLIEIQFLEVIAVATWSEGKGREGKRTWMDSPIFPTEGYLRLISDRTFAYFLII